MKLYFAYGANLNIANMAQRCPSAVAIEPFYLHDYRLMFSGVATIEPAEGARVPGALWAITEACDVMNSAAPDEPGASYLETIAQGYEDFGLGLDDLWAAVQHTKEMQDDMQWSTHTGSPLRDCATDLADHVYLEPGHDLRWLRDVESSHRDPDPIQ